MKPVVVRVFRPQNQGFAKLFGSLEADIVSIIWHSPPASARDIFEALRSQGKKISYGAVKTVLDRLAAKEVLARNQQSNRYIYQASLTRSLQDRWCAKLSKVCLLALATWCMSSYLIESARVLPRSSSALCA